MKDGVSPRAKGLLVGSAALVVLGVVLRSWPIAVSGVVGFVVVVAAAAVALRRLSVEVDRRVEPLRTEVGDEISLTFRFINASDRRSPRLEAVDHGLIDRRLSVPPIEARSERWVPERGSGKSISLVMDRRGRFPAGPLELRRTDPLGLFLISRRQEREVKEVVVYPKTVGLTGLRRGWIRDLEGRGSTASPHGSLAFYGIREYMPGDDPRHVDWKGTARWQAIRPGELLIREFVDSFRPELFLVLDDRSAFHSRETFECAVSAVASIGLMHLESGFPLRVGRACSSVVTAPASTAEFLETCAVVDFDGNDTPSDRLATADLAQVAPLWKGAPNAQLIVLVTGPNTVDDATGAVDSIRGGARRFVIRTGFAFSGNVSSTGRTREAGLERLEDLPHVWEDGQ